LDQEVVSSYQKVVSICIDTLDWDAVLGSDGQVGFVALQSGQVDDRVVAVARTRDDGDVIRDV